MCSCCVRYYHKLSSSKQQTFLIISVGQEPGRNLMRSSAKDLKRLQSKCWLGLKFHLRLYRGRIPSSSGGCWKHSVPCRLLKPRVSAPRWLLAGVCPPWLACYWPEAACVSFPGGPPQHGCLLYQSQQETESPSKTGYNLT